MSAREQAETVEASGGRPHRPPVLREESRFLVPPLSWALTENAWRGAERPRVS